MGSYLGTGPCVTVIDTPSLTDSEGNDAMIMKDFINALKGDLPEGINVFLVLFRGTQMRLDHSAKVQLQLFESIFGEDFWNYVVTGFTWWSHSSLHKTVRKMQCQMREENCDVKRSQEEVKHQEWNTDYKSSFNVGEDMEIPRHVY